MDAKALHRDLYEKRLKLAFSILERPPETLEAVHRAAGRFAEITDLMAKLEEEDES